MENMAEARKGDVIAMSMEFLEAFRDPGLGLVLSTEPIFQGFSTANVTIMFADGTVETMGLSPNLYKIQMRGTK